jgi:Carboxypeptidase regulatory-like domain/TonB dependent receptor
MRSPSKAVRLVGLSIGVFLACLPLFAQTYTGRILGTVTDQTGAALTGAEVVITDVQRGVTRTLTTDHAGEYVAPDLSPGMYKVRAEARGFKSVERLNIQLEVATDVRIDLTLQPGQVSETVIVSGEVPLLDTTSSTLGGTLSNETINDLPLNGRNYENLLQLRPGVMRYPGGGFSTTSTDGLRAEDNAYFIDGLFNSEPFSGQGIINGAGIAGDSATILPIDAIQEFNVQENPPAEYGWKPGAVVNVGLKSGTNSIHGTAFAFGRDGVLDARNYFNTVPNPKTPRTLEQYGGSAGGPIIRDKLFFFGAYEGQQYDVGNSFGGITSPATVSLGGDPTNSIPDAIAALQALNIPISPASLTIAGCTVTGAAPAGVSCNGKGFPTNNGTNPAGPTAIVNGFPNNVTVNNVVGKVDYHVNASSTVTGMYFFGNNSGTVEDFPELQPIWLSLIHTRAQVAGGSWVWVPSSRWVNEARFGYNRLYQPTYNGDHDIPASAYGLDTGVANSPLTGGLPRIGFFGEFQGLGGFKWPKLQGPDTIVQFIDHVSYTRGKHALKFGGELHRDGVSGGAFGNARGSINFGGGMAFATSTALEDFFAGAPTNGSVLAGNPTRQSSNWAYAAFIQDDWRVTKNLTVNLGLRYEFSTIIKEAHDLLGNFDPTLGLVQVGKQVGSPYNSDPTNFAPRAGFAWDPTGKGDTVIRGGGGIVYETINWESFLAFNNSFGLSSIPTGALLNGTPGGGTIQVGNLTPALSTPWDKGPIFGNLSPGNLSCGVADLGGSPCAIMGVDRNLTTPYVVNWTLNVQHAFTPKLSLEVGYVGNHGTNLTGIRDINQPPVGSGYAPICASNPNCEQDARPFIGKFPYLSNIFQMGNIYRSNYNGLQTTLTSRNFHGLSMVAGYTYAHALDDVAANWDFGYGYGLPQDSYNVGREYASSDFDIRHRLTLSMTYAVPGKKSFAQLLEGWQLTSIVTLESSQPWGVMDLGTDVAGTGSLPVSPPASSPDRWDFYGNPQDFRSGPTSIPYFAGGSPNMPAACLTDSAAIGGTASLNQFGCFAKGASVLIPPAFGTFGTMGRNLFPDSGFRNWDFSVAKNWKFGERFGAQFRAEFFNILNHPNFANPYGGQNGFGQNDPSVPGTFGCGCATPDVAAANPVVGSGGSRATQLGLKLLF